MTATSLTTGLSPQHQALINASAISPAIQAGRYRSIGVTEARELGFTGSQARSGLLMLRHTVWGEQDGYQLRPDDPRVDRNGKTIKYETPRGQSNRLDIHPLMLHRVRSPREAIFVTEGARKGDALASLDIPAISLPGVWGWRGSNELGGRTALPDWSEVSIRGSLFVLAFDRDILTKPTVYSALRTLTGFLLAKGAIRVRFLIPPEPYKGVDDLVAGLKGITA